MLNYIEEMVDEMLDEDGDIVIAGMAFSRSAILKEMDPVAYRQVVLEYADARIDDLQYDLERLDPEVDAIEIEELKAQIDELENI